MMKEPGKSKIRVLIPSDNRDFVAELAGAYAKAGCDVVTGAFNFDLRAGEFDLIHYQWPEELCGWVPPTDARLNEIVEGVRWWNERSASLVSIHNLWPHGYAKHPQFRRLFDEFYTGCTRLLHFSATSKSRLLEEFSSARHERHVVTHLWNFDRAVGKQPKRGPCREELGFKADDFVILIFGALRSWSEIQLLQEAFARCRVGGKRLLIAARYNEEPTASGRRWRKLRWRSWLWRVGAVVEERFLPDEELSRYFDTADAVVIPRTCELNSGLPSLAATFGTPIVAPNIGVFAEALAGTENLLYNAGNPESLAAALDAAHRLDRDKTRSANVRLANAWNWESIVGSCLESLKPSAAAC